MQELLQRAEEHFFAGRIHIALKLFEHIKAKDPENYLATTYSADIYAMQKKYAEAVDNYKIALDLSPAPYQEHFRLGQVYYLQRKADPARDAFQEALRARPELAECHYYLGLIYLRFDNDREKAKAAFTLYLQARPEAKERLQIETLLQPGNTP
ncbi:MAG: tetratricopeptide repeat protein [Spirochaetales bacterium]|nr:tetratricopeptide repeat protein [Spirochaetales bacterium]